MEWYGEGQQESEGGKEEGRARRTRREGEREGGGRRLLSALLWVTVAGMRVLPS